METTISVRPLVSAVTKLYVRGERLAEIAYKTGFTRKRVEQCIERLESMLLLIAHDFPRPLIPRVLSLSSEEVQTYLGAIEDELGAPPRVSDFVQRRILSTSEGSANPPASPNLPAGHELDESRAEALNVLDFWASKWL